MKYKADSLGHILTSAWSPASHQSMRYVFISVWIGEIHYFSQNRRLIVTFDLISYDLCCHCSRSTHTGCLHKAVAKWYLIQVTPDLFSGANSTGLNVSNINSELQDISCNPMTKYVMECVVNWLLLVVLLLYDVLIYILLYPFSCEKLKY